MAGTYESVVYEQRKALQAWRSSVAHLGVTAPAEIEALVWELLLLFGDVLAGPSTETDEDIYKENIGTGGTRAQPDGRGDGAQGVP